jgi:hypothetical protein
MASPAHLPSFILHPSNRTTNVVQQYPAYQPCHRNRFTSFLTSHTYRLLFPVSRFACKPRSLSAVHCIQSHHLLSQAPVRRCIPPFSNYRSSQVRGHPFISAVLTSQSSQASTHMQLSSRCQITLQTHRPHSSACCSILRLAKGQRDT